MHFISLLIVATSFGALGASAFQSASSSTEDNVVNVAKKAIDSVEKNTNVNKLNIDKPKEAVQHISQVIGNVKKDLKKDEQAKKDLRKIDKMLENADMKVHIEAIFTNLSELVKKADIDSQLDDEEKIERAQQVIQHAKKALSEKTDGKDCNVF